MDLTNDGGTDTSDVRWLVGEDIPSIGAIRNMAHPPAFGDPDRMGSPFWYSGSDDHGGVHTNSGVGNKLCYLLTDGATFNGLTVAGMGISKVADLFYECQTNLLTPASDYLDLYVALTQAAQNLGYTETERANIEHARQAVEIVAPGDPCGDGMVFDCLMTCVDAAAAQAWIGDGVCDDGTRDMDLTCEEFNKDDGDCCPDNDGDDYGDPASDLCKYPEWDCNDDDPRMHPYADEEEDGIDSNCGCGGDCPAPGHWCDICGTFPVEVRTLADAIPPFAVYLIPLGYLIAKRRRIRNN